MIDDGHGRSPEQVSEARLGDLRAEKHVVDQLPFRALHAADRIERFAPEHHGLAHEERERARLPREGLHLGAKIGVEDHRVAYVTRSPRGRRGHGEGKDGPRIVPCDQISDQATEKIRRRTRVRVAESDDLTARRVGPDDHVVDLPRSLGRRRAREDNTRLPVTASRTMLRDGLHGEIVRGIFCVFEYEYGFDVARVVDTKRRAEIIQLLDVGTLGGPNNRQRRKAGRPVFAVRGPQIGKGPGNATMIPEQLRGKQCANDEQQRWRNHVQGIAPLSPDRGAGSRTAVAMEV